MKVLVIGSLNIDFTSYVNEFPKDGETISSLDYKINFGGKGINQAVALFLSGADVTFLGALGNDGYANEYKDFINKLKLNSTLLMKNTFTGNAQIIVNKKSENKIIINHGANYEITKEDVRNYILNNKDCFDIVVIQNELKKETIEEIISLCGELNKTIVYNPAPTLNINKELYKYITYFIPNEEEIKFYSSHNELNESIECLLKEGMKNILVTLGSKGSLLKNQSEEIFIPAFKVDAIDTVGAGDTFIGYFTSMISQSKNHKDAMTIASKASSIGVTRKGAISSIPNINEVLESLKN